MPDTEMHMRARLEVNAAGSIIGVEFKDNKRVIPEFRTAIVEFLRDNWTGKFTDPILSRPTVEVAASSQLLAL